MSKLLTLLVVSLPVLFLGQALAVRNDLSITLITDVDEYKASHPGGLWQPFRRVGDIFWVLGEHNSNDGRVNFGDVVYSDSFKLQELPNFPDKAITSIVFDFQHKTRDSEAFLVRGGVGQKYASVVVKVPVTVKNMGALSGVVYYDKNSI